MNEELQNKIYNWIAEVSGKIGDWTAEQLPPFINEYLQWKFLEHSMGCVLQVFGILILFGTVTLLFHIAKKLNNTYNKTQNEDYLYGTVMSGAGATLSLAIAIGLLCEGSWYDNGMSAIKIKIAPKVYMLEQVTKFIKH